jgi:hypothetical protein
LKFFSKIYRINNNMDRNFTSVKDICFYLHLSSESKSDRIHNKRLSHPSFRYKYNYISAAFQNMLINISTFFFTRKLVQNYIWKENFLCILRLYHYLINILLFISFLSSQEKFQKALAFYSILFSFVQSAQCNVQFRK